MILKNRPLHDHRSEGRQGRETRLQALAKLIGFAVTTVVGIAIVWLPAVHAQPVPRGNEFQVNSYGHYGQRGPAIDANASGQFVAVWRGDYSLGDDTSSGSTQGRRFDSAGNPVGGDFQVNTYTPFNQRNPDVTVNSDGSFVVVWSGPGIAARLFDSVGNPIGAQFQANTEGASLDDPAVSSAANGDFVVVYHSFYGTLDPDGYGILGQRFSSNGTPLGSEFLVNDYTSGNQKEPEVVMAGDGSFAVVWQSQGSSGTDSLLESIQGKRYDSLGSPIGSESQINTFTAGSQQYPTVDQGSTSTFVVAWQGSDSDGTDSDYESIHARRWNGTPLGVEIQVNTYITSSQVHPSVASDEDGNFVVTWRSGSYIAPGPDGSLSSIQARAVASDGIPVGEEIQVNTYGTSYQIHPAVTYRGKGEFVVVWESYGSSGPDQSYSGILGQHFKGVGLFSDDFESGTTSAWSSAVGE